MFTTSFILRGEHTLLFRKSNRANRGSWGITSPLVDKHRNLRTRTGPAKKKLGETLVKISISPLQIEKFK
jgi:hypothetical protein